MLTSCWENVLELYESKLPNLTGDTPACNDAPGGGGGGGGGVYVDTGFENNAAGLTV